MSREKKKLRALAFGIACTLVMGMTNFAGLYPETVIHAADPDFSITWEDSEEKDVRKGSFIDTNGGKTNVDFKKWDSTTELPTDEGLWYLTKDIELAADWIPASKKISLCLNGHKITKKVVQIGDGSELSIYDTMGDHGLIPSITVTGTGKVNMYGGSISENATSGVIIDGGGTLNMLGGSITKNKDAKGAGVNVINGTFNMEGGSITQNESSSDGGGVYVDSNGTFNFKGGTIDGNKAKGFGGGVFSKGTLDIKGGSITNNTAESVPETSCVRIDNGSACKSDGLLDKDISYNTGNLVTVTFEPNGAEGGTIVQYYKKGENTPLHELVFKKTDDTFKEWNNEPDGSGKEKYAAISNISKSENITLYAIWKNGGSSPTTNKYTITFNANEGTVTPASEKTGTDGKLTSLPTPTRDGYKFKRWTKSQTDDGVAVTTDDVYTADTTIFAQWAASTETEHTISISSSISNGTVKADKTKAWPGDTVTLSYSANSGYKFSTWSMTPSSLSVSNNKFTMPNSDVTVSATFKKDSSSSDRKYKISSITGKSSDSTNSSPVWLRGSGNMVVTLKLSGSSGDDDDAADHFTGVSIDDEDLEEDDEYTAAEASSSSGGVKVTLKKSMLEEFKNGTHDLEFDFDDADSVSVSFTIKNASSSSGSSSSSSSGESGGTGGGTSGSGGKESPKTGEI